MDLAFVQNYDGRNSDCGSFPTICFISISFSYSSLALFHDSVDFPTSFMEYGLSLNMSFTVASHSLFQDINNHSTDNNEPDW